MMMTMTVSNGFPSDIRVIEAEPIFTHEKARTPLKFGGVVMAEALFFKCRVKVENRRGNVAEGWGGIFLADFWAWPSAVVEHEQRERVMREVSIEYTKLLNEYSKFAHPIDIFLETEDELKRITTQVCQRLGTYECTEEWHFF
ncbi:MAG TPA: hypothetical protein EYP10_01600, partial [Armatimonadetes bacterium]|nr:hypothetical protein [Armatimonadota bacterium]